MKSTSTAGWDGQRAAITSGYKGFKFAPAWSPDSKKIAWADKDLQVWYVDVADKKPVLIEKPVKAGAYSKDVFGEITDYTWSPDSKWISYSKPSENGNNVLYLYSLASAKITPVTTNFFNSNAAGVRSGREVSLLSVGSGLQRGAGEFRLRIRKSEDDADLSGDFEERVSHHRSRR